MNITDQRAPIERLRSHASQAGISINALAKQCHLNPRTVSDNFALQSEPKMGTIVAIANFFGLSLNWVLTGFGPMLLKDCTLDPSNVQFQERKVEDNYTINIGTGTQTVSTDAPAPAPTQRDRITDTALLIKQLIEQNHQLYEQNVLLMDQNRSITEQLIKLINK